MAILIENAVGEVICVLAAREYAEGTLLEYRKTFKRLVAFAAEAGTSEYSQELGKAFSAAVVSPRTGQFSRYRRKMHRRCVRLLDSLVATGQVDTSAFAWQVKSRPGAPAYCCALKDFQASMEEDGLASGTIDMRIRLASDYLIYLESIGCKRLDDATPRTIIGFAVSLRKRWQATSMKSALNSFRPFVRYLGRGDLIEAACSIKTPGQRKIMPVLSGHEEGALWDILRSDSITNRDRSIVLLGLLTGIRACDIIALELDDICWRCDCISIIQQKTGNPLTLPLVPVVGNAIYAYLTKERPNSASSRIFLRSVAPYTGLSDHASVYHIIKKAFTRAGIHKAGRLCGSRLLRHNAATGMLAAEVALPTIAAVLGHADPQSTDIYLSVDEISLKSCVLPLRTEVR